MSHGARRRCAGTASDGAGASRALRAGTTARA